jgi:predicted phage baseplate assembly protein
VPIVSPDLDDLRHDRVVAHLRRQIPIHAPEWTDHNDSDPGVTLIQLFGYLAEQIGYRLNQVPEKSYIEFLKLIGIRLRPAEAARTTMAFVLAKPELAEAFSVPRGSRIKAKTSTGTAPVFETDVDADVVPAQLAALVTTRSPDIRDIALTASGSREPIADDQTSGSYVPARFSLVWNGTTPRLEKMPVQPVGVLQRESETEHAHLWLGLAFNPARSAGFLGQRVTLHVQLDDDEQPDAEAVADCDTAETELVAVDEDGNQQELVSYAYYRSAQIGQTTGSFQLLRPLRDTTEGWTRSGQIRFDVPLSMGPIPDSEWIDARGPQPLTTEEICKQATGTAEPLPVPIPHPLVGAIKSPVTGTPAAVPVSGWLRVSFVQQPRPRLRLRLLGFNLAPASNAETILNESLGRGTGVPGQSVTLAHGNVLTDTLDLAVVAAEDDLFHQWTEVPDLDTAGPRDRVYILDREAGQITFGDGLRGQPPEIDASMVARRYRHGGGVAAEVDVGAVNQPDSLPAPIATAVNVVAARGGKNAETLQEAKARAPRHLAVRGRAVTAGDFEFIARETPGLRVARAVVVPLHMPYPEGSELAPGLDLEARAPGVVSVVVVPDQVGLYPTPTEGMLRAVCRHLDGYRLITTEVYAVSPQYVRLFDVTVAVRPAAGYTRAALREAIGKRLETYFHVLRGGAEGTGFPFGATLHHADLVAQIFRVEGVERVEEVDALFDGHAPEGADPALAWRQERRIPQRLTNCPVTGAATEETDRIVLAADETIFVDTATLNVIVRT